MAGERDKVEGAWDETKGKVKQAVGDATDDESARDEGEKDELKGKVKGAKGDLKDAGEKVKDSINKAFD